MLYPIGITLSVIHVDFTKLGSHINVVKITLVCASVQSCMCKYWCGG